MCKAQVKKCHLQQTNTQFLGRMSFLSPDQQCQSTEGQRSNSVSIVVILMTVGVDVDPV